jgi:hypothetical protein
MLHHVYLRFVPVSNIFLLLADLITCDLCSKCTHFRTKDTRYKIFYFQIMGPHKGIKNTNIQRKNHNYIEYSSNIFLLLADLITCDLCSKCCVRRGHSMCPFFTFFSMKQLELNLAMLILNNVCGFHFSYHINSIYGNIILFYNFNKSKHNWQNEMKTTNIVEDQHGQV